MELIQDDIFRAQTGDRWAWSLIVKYAYNSVVHNVCLPLSHKENSKSRDTISRFVGLLNGELVFVSSPFIIFLVSSSPQSRLSLQTYFKFKLSSGTEGPLILCNFFEEACNNTTTRSQTQSRLRRSLASVSSLSYGHVLTSSSFDRPCFMPNGTMSWTQIITMHAICMRPCCSVQTRHILRSRL